ncbi:hypothetical protein [Solibacillus sp. FSL H8-0538]|uniref:hypothetical protein n=1 Tax=Solibacillus sp. FSL H8-0538 TaxID=2921400 RepID=UPI0030FCA497
MRVLLATSTSESFRSNNYNARTHFAIYDPTSLENRATVVTKFENGIYKRYLEKANGQRDLLIASSTREKMFLEKRIKHANREEMMQRLNYTNGVHYSTINNIFFQH